MESLEQIIGKMEAPLLFAAENGYSRLPLIKNLEVAMTSLLRSLKEALSSGPEPLNREMDRLTDTLLGLFDGYDRASPEQKKPVLSRLHPICRHLKSS